MFAEIGEGCYRAAPSRHLRGAFVHFGKNVYANFNLTLVDDTHIYVGDYTMFKPNVTLTAARHPIHPKLRSRATSTMRLFVLEKIAGSGRAYLIMPGNNYWR